MYDIYKLWRSYTYMYKLGHSPERHQIRRDAIVYASDGGKSGLYGNGTRGCVAD
jgi:hypothetical protein